MNVSTPLLSMFALIVGMTANEALADNPAVQLTVEESRLYVKDVPVLKDLTGAILPDQKAIDLEVDKQAFANFFARLQPKGEGAFYREYRNPRDEQAEIRIKYLTGKSDFVNFAIGAAAPNTQIITPNDLLFGLGVKVRVTVDVYKCFNPETCIFEAVKTETVLPDFDGGVELRYDFEPLVTCRDHTLLQVEASVQYPEIQRIIIDRTTARHYFKTAEVLNGKGAAARTGAEFQGFVTDIGENGLYHEVAPGTMLEVVRQGDVIELTTRRPGGQVRTQRRVGGCVNLR